MADEQAENNNVSSPDDIEEIVKQRVYNKNKELERKTMENEQLKQQLAQIQEQMNNTAQDEASPQENMQPAMQSQNDMQQSQNVDGSPLTRQDLMDAQQNMQENMENERHKQKIGELLNGDPKLRDAAEKFNKIMPLEVEKDLVNNLPEDESKKILHSIMTNEDVYNKMFTKLHESALYGNPDAYTNWVKSQLNQNPTESQAPNEGPDLKGSEGAPEIDKMAAIKGYLKR